MKTTVYTAFDVGKNGGIATIHANGHVDVAITPLIGKGKGSEIDIPAIAKLLKEMKAEAEFAGGDLLVAIEDVHAIFGVSAGSTFNFGRALGLLEGLCYGMGIAFLKVAPKEWQSIAYQGVPVIEKAGTKAKGAKRYDTKAMSLIAATRLYPNVRLQKSAKAEKPHDGIVDALLIAHYLKNKYK